MGGFEDIVELLPFLIPLVLLELALLGIALFDLIKRQRVKGGNKLLWGVVIVIFGIIGPAVYLILGREED